MIRKYLSYFLFSTIFLCQISFAENPNFRVIDINFIMNNSIAGKKILENLDKKNKIEIQKLKDIEKNLKSAKEKIISQKNILNQEEFNKKVEDHQLKVVNYQSKKNKSLDLMNKRKLELTNKLLKSINEIIINFAKQNSIDVILKKETILVSQSNVDITKEILELINKNIKNID